MITIVDYGLGNIAALANIYSRLGVQYVVANDSNSLSMASRLILPGVGSFDWAMQRLEASGMRPALDDLVLNRSVPVLGICVGMQMMADRSDEGHMSGLGWIKGEVNLFSNSLLSDRFCLPHMGWNDVHPINHPLFSGIPDPRFYFLHSYFFVPASSSHVLAESNYVQNFCAAVCKDNIMGVQFHPEKSHHWGIKLLENFSQI